MTEFGRVITQNEHNLHNGNFQFIESAAQILRRDNQRIAFREKRTICIENPLKSYDFSGFSGRSVIIGFQKTQIYQRFSGSRQEVFILKILEFENNAAQQDNGRRCSFLNVGTNCPKLVPLKHGPGGISPVAAYRSEQPGAVCQGCITPMFIGDLPLTGAPGCSAFCCKL